MSAITAEAICLVMRLGSTAVLARLLLPEHFGVIAMVMAVTVVVERFKDLGLCDAAVQRREISHGEVSTLFWINAAIGVGLTGILSALSNPLAWWYGDERVASVTAALSFTFLFASVTVQHQAMLRRRMWYGYLAAVQILATASGIAVAVGLAIEGYEHWALVWKELTTSLVMTVGIWAVDPWVPGLPRSHSGVVAMLHFGRNVTVFNATYFASRSLDQILLGKFWGPGFVGLYRQAYQLIAMLVSQVQFPFAHVSLPALSRLQSNSERYCRYYERYLSLLLFVSMPLSVYFAIFAESIVRLVLGVNWSEAAPILRVLSIGALIYPVTESVGLVLMTLGDTKRYCLWGIMCALCLTTAMLAGLPWGPMGVAAAYSAAGYVALVPSLLSFLQDTPVPWSLAIRTMIWPFSCSVIMGVVLLMAVRGSEWIGSPAGTPISLMIALAAYCGAWSLMPGGSERMSAYLHYVYEALGGTPPARPSAGGGAGQPAV